MRNHLEERGSLNWCGELQFCAGAASAAAGGKGGRKLVSAFMQGRWWPPLTGELFLWLWPILRMLVDSFNIFYIFLIGTFILVLDFLFFFSISPPFVKVDVCHCPPATLCTDAHFPFSYHFVVMLGVSSMFVFYYDHSVNAVHSGPCCHLRLLSFPTPFCFLCS